MPRGKAKATDDMKATEDLTFKEARVRVLDAERQSAAADRARALLDLEKQRISQLIDIVCDSCYPAGPHAFSSQCVSVLTPVCIVPTAERLQHAGVPASWLCNRCSWR
jgi:hypothetical protein